MICFTSYELVTPPVCEPVDLVAQKLHSKIDHDADNELVDACIKAARRHLENTFGIICIEQTWRMYLARFPYEITIRKRPVKSVTSIKYIDETGTEQTLNSNAYQVDLRGFLTRIWSSFGTYWPTARRETYNAVTVEFVAGYGGDPEDVNEAVIAALKLHAGDLYAHRETVVVGPPIANLRTYEALINPERIWPV